jgi:hypothetical protein
MRHWRLRENATRPPKPQVVSTVPCKVPIIDYLEYIKLPFNVNNISHKEKQDFP